MIITIDGPSGTGKTTVAHEIAKRLGFHCFDTGAMYRCVAFKSMQDGLNIDSDSGLLEMLKNFSFIIKNDRYFVNGVDVTDKIRTEEISKRASILAAKEFVRQNLWSLQRKFAEGGNSVFEGRDMGSVVFPFADFKFFLTASAEVRAKRRLKELQDKNPNMKFSYDEILHSVKERDDFDSKRALAPLICPKHAIIIDTSNISKDEVINKILFKINASLTKVRDS